MKVEGNILGKHGGVINEKEKKRDRGEWVMRMNELKAYCIF